MDPVLKAVLLSWDWRLEVILVLALAGTFYTVGWLRLRRKTARRENRPGRPRQLAGRWRLVAYWAGLLALFLALLSPIDTLGQQLFSAHMIQHLLLIMIAPPLLLLANPLPFNLWGLPRRPRLRVGHLLSQLLHGRSPFRAGLCRLTAPGIVWLFWVVALIGWHDPVAYTAALNNDRIHDLEHLTFFLAGMLFWWHVVGAGPRIHRQFGVIGRTVFVLSAVPPNMALGVVLAFLAAPLYTYYEAVPRLWGISPLTDQQIGAVIMWIPGSMMYIIAALILVAGLVQEEDLKPPLAESTWATEEAMAAPGLD